MREDLAIAKLARYRCEIQQIDAKISVEMRKPILKRSHHRLLLLLYRERVKYSFAEKELAELFISES